MQGKILIIEDEKELSDIVSFYLAKEGFEVRAVESAEDAIALLENGAVGAPKSGAGQNGAVGALKSGAGQNGAWKPELIILDINLPGMDGFEFLQRLRRGDATPVIVVSARDSDEDLICGFSGGADEFVTKPFSPKVLVARVRALFRRLRNIDAGGRRCVFGPFVLDYDACLLKKNGEKVPLSATEYGCLEFLTENNGKPLSPETIHTAVWKSIYGDITTVAVYIQRLRKKIEDDYANPVYIETVHGMGYRFNLNAEGGEIRHGN